MAEAAGDAAARSNYLRQALVVDPEYAPAHWQLGEIKVDNKWLATDSAATTSAWLETISEYQHRRARSVRTADSQIMLAKWCESAGLADQAKMHWRAAMSTRPKLNQQREIFSKLGLVRYRKRLMPAATAEVLRKQAKEAEAAVQKWKPLLTRLRGDLESRDTARQESAAQQLKDLHDLSVIPVLEAVFAKATPEAGVAAIGALAFMPQQAATDSLVRHAIFAKHEEVRKAAAGALKPRDVFTYVPMLLASMNTPIEISFQYGVTEGGSLREAPVSLSRGPDAQCGVRLRGHDFPSSARHRQPDFGVQGRSRPVWRRTNHGYRTASRGGLPIGCPSSSHE